MSVSYAGAITALTFRNLKQMTIKESLGVEKNTLNSTCVIVVLLWHCSMRESCLSATSRLLPV